MWVLLGVGFFSEEAVFWGGIFSEKTASEGSLHVVYFDHRSGAAPRTLFEIDVKHRKTPEFH